MANPVRIFLDTNGNKTYDAATEISVTPNPQGFYTFVPFALTQGDLGRLAAFDTNHNGIIDPSEGVFRIVGGQDQDNGLTSQNRVESTADGYGTGVRFASSPLVEVRRELIDPTIIGSTVSGDSADRLVELAFGLPLYIDVKTFDPRDPAAAGRNSEVLTGAAEIGVLVLDGTGLIQGAANGNLGVDTVQAAIYAALARRVAAITLTKSVDQYITLNPTTHKIIGGVPMVDLSNPSEISAILADAAKSLNVKVNRPAFTADGTNSVNLLQYTAGVIASHNGYVQRLGQAGLPNLNVVLASVKSFTQVMTATIIKSVAADELTTDEATSQISLAQLKKSLSGLNLPVLSEAPVLVSAIGDKTVRPSQLIQIPVSISDPGQSPGAVVLTIVSSSNASVVTKASITTTGTGKDRVVQFTTGSAVGQSSTITLLLNDGTGAGGQTTISFKVTLSATAPASLAAYLWPTVSEARPMWMPFAPEAVSIPLLVLSPLNFGSTHPLGAFDWLELDPPDELLGQIGTSERLNAGVQTL